ncbi:MAG TPA: hypothetical protein VKB60_05275, partial [Terriglobales bacterium]|nr:hypothetical protein [Terriglobales bacterium]
MSRAAAIEIVRTLRQAGHQAYLAGGCVRDLVLGREPADYDVVTDATPDQVMRTFAQSYAVGAQFGVVLVPADGVIPSQASSPPQTTGRDVARNVSEAPQRKDAERDVTSYVSTEAGEDRGQLFTTERSGKAAVIEVATFRSDIGYSDGRHPDQVHYTRSPQEDVQRRDFTINGLLYDPIEDKVLDYVGGLADIRRGVVQTIGDPE